MKRIILMLTVAAMMVAALTITSAGSCAVSPSRAQCEAEGGTFTRTQGEVKCVIVDEGKNPRFTETETSTGQGNAGNKPTRDTDCGGTGSGKCPPGQFND